MLPLGQIIHMHHAGFHYCVRVNARTTHVSFILTCPDLKLCIPSSFPAVEWLQVRNDYKNTFLSPALQQCWQILIWSQSGNKVLFSSFPFTVWGAMFYNPALSHWDSFFLSTARVENVNRGFYLLHNTPNICRAQSIQNKAQWFSYVENGSASLACLGFWTQIKRNKSSLFIYKAH